MPRKCSASSALFRHNDYALKPLLKALYMSAYFRAANHRGTMIKSPVELIVGTLRLLHVPVNDPDPLVRAGRYLGQDLFDPPNVKGWPGGNAWITSSTLLARQQFLQRVLRGQDMSSSTDGQMVPGLPAEQLTHMLLPIVPVHPLPKDAEGRRLLEYLLLDPVYQLQ